MKKLILFTFILVIIYSLPLYAQEERPIDKKLEVVGKEIENDYQILAYGTSFFGGIWKKLNKEQKGCYLAGFEDGSVDIVARYILENKRGEITDELPSFYGLGEDTLIEKLDEFYANIVNLNIPLPLALTIIRADFQELSYDANTKWLIEFYRKELDSLVKDNSEESIK